MAEPDTFLLDITDGTTTCDLNDGLNFSLNDSGWQPLLPPDEYTERVIEALSINVLGAEDIGGENHAKKTLRNFDTLRELLRQAIRAHDDAAVNAVRLRYCPQNHGSKAIYSAVLYEWLMPQLVDGINAASMLGANQTIEGLILNLDHRTPWAVSYVNDNTQEQTIWKTDPAWTLAGDGSLSYQAITTPYGAEGAQTITYVGAGSSTLVAPASQNDLVISVGDTCTVFVRVASTVAGTLTADLRNAANLASLTNTPATQALVASTETITSFDSQWLCFNLTASGSMSANARPRFTVTASGAGTVTLAEVLILQDTHAVDDDRWHMASLDLQYPDSVTSITVPTVTTISTDVLSQTPTPMTAYVGFNGTGSHADAFKTGVTIINSQPIDIYALNGYTATGFTSVLDNLLAYPSGNVLRYSPSTANTWQATADITLTNPARHIAVLAAVRNNSSTATFLTKFTGILAGGFSTHESRPVTIGPHGGTAAPQYVHLGEIHHYRPFQKIRLNCQGTATGQTLDLNRIIVVSLADDTAIISHVDLYDITMPDRLELINNWSTASEPQYDIFTAASAFVDIVPTIDNVLVRTRGETVCFLIDGVSQQRWRYTADGTNAETYTLTLQRTPVVEFPR